MERARADRAPSPSKSLVRAQLDGETVVDAELEPRFLHLRLALVLAMVALLGLVVLSSFLLG